MPSQNQVTIVGNLTRDPELKYTQGGQALVNLSVAVNRKWQNKQTQTWEEATSYFDVTAWAQLAENVAESLPKGARVIVCGRLDQREWEDKETGQKRTKVDITADEIGPSLQWATAEVRKAERDRPAKPDAQAPRPTTVDSDGTPF